MSGVAVQFNRDGRPVDVGDVWAMLDVIPFRGPDGMWLRSWDTVALGFAKLTITPEEVDEQQPVVSSRTGCAIVADIRLDNRNDLLANLPGWVDPSTSDAELVLRAYETWGEAALPRLLGDFALVIWDPRDQCLRCARDTSGQRTLYYRIDRHTFAAASDVHQLLQHPDVQVNPNEERIVDYLVPVSFFRNEKDHHETFFRGIYSVPAGHLLTVRAGRQELRQYWRLDPPQEIYYRSDSEYAEHFRGLFDEVVRARMRTVHPIGAFLSGGLDSSSIVCTAQELIGSGKAADRGFVSFSIVYDGLECDERALIEKVQAKYGFASEYLPCPAAADRLNLDPIGFRESPNSDLAEISDILERADATGVRTLFTGDIADAYIGGSRLTFDSLIRRGQFRDLRDHVRAYKRATNDSWKRIISLYSLTPLLPLIAQRQILTFQLDRDLRQAGPRLLPTWVSPKLVDRLLERNRQLVRKQLSDILFTSPAKQEAYSLLYPPESPVIPSGYKVNVVRPFADRRLHEFMLAVPPERTFSPHHESSAFYAGSKRILRNAMNGALPEEIRTRTEKAVFNGVFVGEIERHWDRYVETFGPGANPEIARRDYINQDDFWLALQDLRSGSARRDFLYIRSMVEFETWFRGFADTRREDLVTPKRVRRSPAMAPI